MLLKVTVVQEGWGFWEKKERSRNGGRTRDRVISNYHLNQGLQSPGATAQWILQH